MFRFFCGFVIGRIICMSICKSGRYGACVCVSLTCLDMRCKVEGILEKDA